MSRIFLSHSSSDNFEAKALHDWLASEGWRDVFLDLDPVRGIEAGQRWERRLHEAASRCEAVVFLVSSNWLASDWCLKEYTVARRLNKKLFAVLVDPAKKIKDLPAALTDTWQVIDLAGGQDMQLFRAVLPGSHEEKHVGFSGDGLTRLKRGLQKAGLDPRFFAWPPVNEPGRVPYRGLKPLEAADAGIFFGRDAPIVEATDRLRGVGTGAPPRLMVILGASGAGKSSFLRAGLLPRLARDDSHFVTLPPIRPERAALYGENGLLRALELACPARTRAELRSALQAGATGLRPILADLVQQTFRQTLAEEGSTRAPTIVIAIDQAEELFRADAGIEGQELLDLVRDLTASDITIAVIVIFAVRSDSYDELEHAKALGGLRQEPFALLPMPRGAYKEVIEGPAHRVNEAGGKLTIEPQLTERLLAVIEAGGGSDALPLLAFTLEQLYLEYHRAGVLRLVDYEAIGGLGGAIDRAVARAFIRADVDPRIPRERTAREQLLRRGLIPWLCGIDPDTKSPRRNIARLADIPAEAAPLIGLLVEERLLSTDTQRSRDPVTGEDVRTATIEPTHEALLRQWGLLKSWLAEDFGLLATLEGLKRAAREWDANARYGAWLAHQGQRLSEAQGLDERPDIAVRLDATDRLYIAACRQRQTAVQNEIDQRRLEREAEQERRVADAQALAIATRRTVQRTRMGLIVAISLATIAGAMGLFARGEKTLADQKTVEAEAQRDAAARAETVAKRQKTIADQEAVEAKAQREAALRAEASSKQQSQIAEHNQSAALAGLSVASLQQDPIKATLLALASLPRTDARRASTMQFQLAALSASTAAIKERAVLQAEQNIRDAVFSLDAMLVVTISNNDFGGNEPPTAKLWDVKTGNLISIMEGDVGDFLSAAISPDSSMVSATSVDGIVRLWKVGTLRMANNEPSITFTGHQKEVWSVRFSEDGGRLVTASSDTTARLWSTTSGKRIATLEGHKAPVNTAVFSQNDKKIVTSSDDGTAKIWDAFTGQFLDNLDCHNGKLIGAIYSPDSSKIASFSDSAICMWDAATAGLLKVISGVGIAAVSFSPDGTSLLTVSDGDKVSLWNIAEGRRTLTYSGHTSRVNSAQFSHDGLRVITAAADHKARLFDASTGVLISALAGHNGEVDNALFSQNDEIVLTFSDEDKTARLWNAGFGKVSRILHGKGQLPSGAIVSQNGKYIVILDNISGLYDSFTGKFLVSLAGHGQFGATEAEFSPDSRLLIIGSYDEWAGIWEVPSGNLVAKLQHKGAAVWGARFSLDGKSAVTTSNDGTVHIWSSPKWTLRRTIVVPGATWASFSPDGHRVLVISSKEPASVWNVLTGECLFLLDSGSKTIYKAEYGPNGRYIITLNGDKAFVWEASTGQLLRAIGSEVAGAKLDFDEKRVVTFGNGNVDIWQLADDKHVSIYTNRLQKEDAFNTIDIDDVAFSPDGKRVAIAYGSERAISQPPTILCDATTGGMLTRMLGHSKSVVTVVFTPDGQSLITASQDNTARIWDIGSIPSGTIFKVACESLPEKDLSKIKEEYGFASLAPICIGETPPK